MNLNKHLIALNDLSTLYLSIYLFQTEIDSFIGYLLITNSKYKVLCIITIIYLVPISSIDTYYLCKLIS